jgi:hypothetical protein
MRSPGTGVISSFSLFGLRKIFAVAQRLIECLAERGDALSRRARGASERPCHDLSRKSDREHLPLFVGLSHSR